MSNTAPKLVFDDVQIRLLFGSEDAESEPAERFKEYFVRNRAYENLTAQLPLRILVGHKGVGKSALLRYSHEQDLGAGKLSIFLKPDDLADLLKGAGDEDINSRIEAWKHGIRRKVIDKALEFATDGAIDQLDETRIKSGVRKISSVLLDAFKAWQPEIHAAAKESLYSNFVKEQALTIYIDDVDRGWSARPQDVLNISALINALKDICSRDVKVQCRIALRTDVYYLVRTSDESTDKIEQDVIRLTWTNDEILRLMGHRVATYLGLPISRAQISSMSQNEVTREVLAHVMEPKFHGRGKWENERVHRVMMSLCRARPRDLIKLLHGAARKAAERGADKISTQDFIGSFPLYSEERLQDLFNEFRSEMPNIENFIVQFKPTKRQRTTAENYHYTTDKLINKIRNARQSIPVKFNSGRVTSEKALMTFLYKIDFVIAKFEADGRPQWRYFDQSRFLAHEFTDFGNSWEVHPAYRWALQPNDIQGVIDTVTLQ